MRKLLAAVAYAFGLSASASAQVVPIGNGTPAVFPPEVLQSRTVLGVGTSITLTPFVTAGTGVGHELICIAVNLLGNAFALPSGYLLLGTTAANSVQLSVYYRSPPTGNASDNCVLNDSASAAKGGEIFEVANGSTPAGYLGQAMASANTFTTPAITAAQYDLLVAVFVPNGTVGPAANIVPTWIPAGTLSGTVGSTFGVETTKAYILPQAYTANGNFAAAVAGLDAIFRIPTNGD